MTPRPTSCTYCFTPQAWETTIEEYPAPSLPSADGSSECQISRPVSLSRATIMALVAPGVQRTQSPSTSGDSENPQPDIISPCQSLKSRDQISLPSAVFRQTILPLEAIAYSRSPSMLGVQREPSCPCLGTASVMFFFQITLPSGALMQMTACPSAWLPVE